MKHIDKEQMHAYLDQELSEKDKQSVEAHLASCGLCKRELGRLSLLFQEIESIPIVDLQMDLTSTVLDSLRPRISLPIRFRVLSVLQVISAAVLLGILWPAINSSLLQFRTISITWDMNEWIQQGLILIQPTLAEGVNLISSWLQGLLMGMDFNVPIWPISYWWFVLLGGLLLWVVGNGFLLSQFEPRSNGD